MWWNKSILVLSQNLKGKPCGVISRLLWFFQNKMIWCRFSCESTKSRPILQVYFGYDFGSDWFEAWNLGYDLGVMLSVWKACGFGWHVIKMWQAVKFYGFHVFLGCHVAYVRCQVPLIYMLGDTIHSANKRLTLCHHVTITLYLKIKFVGWTKFGVREEKGLDLMSFEPKLTTLYSIAF